MRSAGLCLSSRIIPTILSSTCSSSAGNLASSKVAGLRSGAPGSFGVARAGAARWLRAGAARSEVGESSLALDRSGAPGLLEQMQLDCFEQVQLEVRLVSPHLR